MSSSLAFALLLVLAAAAWCPLSLAMHLIRIPLVVYGLYLTRRAATPPPRLPCCTTPRPGPCAHAAHAHIHAAHPTTSVPLVSEEV